MPVHGQRPHAPLQPGSRTPTPACLLPPHRVERLYRYKNEKNDEPAPLIADDVYEIIMAVSRRAVRV